MIESKKLVPKHYANSRDYQVFLKLLDIVINACDFDTKHFTSLISPVQCKARLLPLLSNYVGYTYDYAETVKLNRLITKNWAALKRNRGSLTGISMAIALALNGVIDDSVDSILELFNLDFSSTVNKYDQEINKILLYLHYKGYASKMYDLIEAVRPAGVGLDVINSIPVSSTETVVLTDEYEMLGYNYTTGKLIKLGDIDILVDNNWEILYNGVSTGESVVDGVIKDEYNNDTGKYIDGAQRIMDGDTFTGEIIKAPHIYKVVDFEENTPSYLIYDDNGTKKTLKYTGKHFNLEHSARVLNTCYVICIGGKLSTNFVKCDTWEIVNNNDDPPLFKLVNYNYNGTVVKKLMSTVKGEYCNWHIDNETGYFVKDDIGKDPASFSDEVPWDEYSYISKKRYITNKSPSGVIYTTKYFVNRHEDIQDDAGNIILSVKDRYKVSDSCGIGFSEVHSNSANIDYNKTWLWNRSRMYGSDKDFYNTYTIEDFNDYNDDPKLEDDRITLLPSDFYIENIVSREYDGTNNIGTLDAESTSIIQGNRATIPIDSIDGSDYSPSLCYINISKSLYGSDNILDVFKELIFEFENNEIGNNKPVFMYWKAKDNASQRYNFGFLPERIAFSQKGHIKKRKLKFDGSDIIVKNKIYDGTTRPHEPVSIENEGDNK